MEKTSHKRLLFRIDEAAEILAISRSKIYEYGNAGRLEFVNVDRSRRVTGRSIDKLVETLIKQSSAT